MRGISNHFDYFGVTGLRGSGAGGLTALPLGDRVGSTGWASPPTLPRGKLLLLGALGGVGLRPSGPPGGAALRSQPAKTVTINPRIRGRMTIAPVEGRWLGFSGNGQPFADAHGALTGPRLAA